MNPDNLEHDALEHDKRANDFEKRAQDERRNASVKRQQAAEVRIHQAHDIEKEANRQAQAARSNRGLGQSAFF